MGTDNHLYEVTCPSFIRGVDFFQYVWQYGRIMQKIERWRVQELMLVLEQLSEILRKGNHIDWANVFRHYYDESSQILSQHEISTDKLRRLVGNIQNCFTSVDSFRNLRFSDEAEVSDLSQILLQTKARLFQLIGELRIRMMEYVH